MNISNNFCNSKNFFEWKQRTIVKKNIYSLGVQIANLKFYFGFDNNEHNTIRIETHIQNKLCKNYSSKAISVSFFQESQINNILMSLQDNSLTEVFSELFKYLISSINDSMNEGTAIKEIFNRYEQWLKLFNKGKYGLSQIEQIGLFGELNFIIDSVNNNYIPIETMINSWCGIDFEEVDFVVNNQWTEVKTRLSSNELVHISSVGQLDHPRQGKLCVYTLERFEDGLSLNDCYNLVLRQIQQTKNSELLLKFQTLLENFGYLCLPIYDLNHYSIKEKVLYNVDDSFPKIPRSIKTTQMKNITYTLIVDSLEPWRIR